MQALQDPGKESKGNEPPHVNCCGNPLPRFVKQELVDSDIAVE